MSENTENSVMMKCDHCGYKESVPEWVLEELNIFSNDDSYEMCCPKCDQTMHKAIQ